MTLAEGRDNEPTVDYLEFERLADDCLNVTGEWKGKALEAEFSERDLEELLPISRGSHWINERPLNP